VPHILVTPKEGGGWPGPATIGWKGKEREVLCTRHATANFYKFVRMVLRDGVVMLTHPEQKDLCHEVESRMKT
jgi:hypothetical protein